MGGDATVTVSAPLTYGLVATLQYSKTAPFIAGTEWPVTLVAQVELSSVAPER